MKIGVIGDDFTGSSDAANTLARAGARTLQYAGIPEGAPAPGIDAAVISLKTRSVPVADAVAQSLAACRWLVANGRGAGRVQVLLHLRSRRPRATSDRWPRR